jgi:assimilatory nitrate reductase catalytic subunit
MRAASSEAPDLSMIQEIEQLIGLNSSNTLRYVDVKRNQLRSMRLEHSETNSIKKTQLNAFLIAGDTTAENWLKSLLQTQASTQEYGRRLLMTGSKPPIALVETGHTVCSCLGVKDIAIKNHLKIYKGDSSQCLASLQGTLKCGTQCGSCVPELRRMIEMNVMNEATL